MFRTHLYKSHPTKSQGPQKLIRAKLFRSQLEQLEDRCMPSTFMVLNTEDDGAGSLRQAIVDANAAANAVGIPDRIEFNIPGAGVHTITPGATNGLLTGRGGLPVITDSVVIDGYTQPLNDGSGNLASPNTNGPGLGDNAVIRIELDGSSAGNANGLLFNLFMNRESNVLRGLAINRFSGAGVVLELRSTLVQVQGNFIGTDASGAFARGNLGGGIVVGGSGNTIGGTAPSMRNVISGNGGDGLTFGNNGGYGNGGNLVQGNFIGIDATGTVAMSNQSGVVIAGASNNMIGGLTPAERNVISGNKYDGIGDVMGGVSGGRNRIQGNLIGTQIDGVSPLGNGRDGVGIDNSGAGDTIGGTTSEAGNVIAFNAAVGVHLGRTSNVSVLGNAIFANGGLGIESTFAPASPVLTDVASTSNETHIAGTLDSIPNTAFRIEFFASATADPSGFGEGQIFVGFTTASTNANGLVNYYAALETLIPAGQFVVATATTLDGNGNPLETSEFSAVFTSVEEPPINSPPTAIDDELTVEQFGSNGVNVLANDFDSDDGDLIRLVSVDLSQAGATLEISPGGDIIYTAPDGFLGEDTFRYTIADSSGHLASATVHVTVVPRGPVAVDDELTVERDATGSVNVLANDFDPDAGDTIRLVSVELSQAGAKLQVYPNGDITYIPPPGFVGLDHFRYTIADSDGHLASATVFVRVYLFNSAPTAVLDVAPAGLVVLFDGSRSVDSDAGDSIQQYHWTFGDGSSTLFTSASQVSHTYARGGTYIATLIVVDSVGALSNMDTRSVFINTNPTAVLRATPASLAVLFDGSRSVDSDAGDSIQQYHWSFGDGSSTLLTSAPQVSHTYATDGTYIATLIVVDSFGALSVPQSLTVTVVNTNSPPVFISSPVTVIGLDLPFLYGIQTADPDQGDVRTITALTKPDWLKLVDHGDGTASLFAEAFTTEIGLFAIDLQVEDAAGATAIQSFVLAVGATNALERARDLKNLGHSPFEIGKSIKNEFGTNARDLALILKTIDFNVIPISQTLADLFHLSPPEAATTLRGAGFDSGAATQALLGVFNRPVHQIASDLRAAGFSGPDAFAGLTTKGNLQDQAAANDMKGAGYTENDIGQALVDVLDRNAGQVVVVLKGSGFTVNQVSQMLATVFQQSAPLMATTLRLAGYTANKVAMVLVQVVQAESNEAAAIMRNAGFAATQIVIAFESVYNWTAQKAAIGLQRAAFTASDTIPAIISGFQLTVQQAVNAVKNAGYETTQIAQALVDALDWAEQKVVPVLKAATFSASQVADALEAVFHRTAQQATDRLQSAGYTVTEISVALAIALNQDGQKALIILKEAAFTTTQIAQGLIAAYSFTAQQTASGLQAVGLTALQVSHMLKAAFNRTPEQAALILNNAKFLAAPVLHAIKDGFNVTEQVALAAAKGAGYSVTEIAQGAVSAFNWARQKVANGLKLAGFNPSQIAQSLRQVFSLAKQETANILKAAGFNPSQVGQAVKDAFSLVKQDTANVLKAAGFTASQVGQGVKDTYILADQAVADVLKSAGFGANQIGQAIKDVFAGDAHAVANVLKTAGFDPTQNGKMLSVVFHQTATQAGQIFKAISYSPDQIAKMLKDVFALNALSIATQMFSSLGFGRSAIAGALGAVGFPADVIAFVLNLLFGAGP